jgi:hypothetical protein
MERGHPVGLSAQREPSYPMSVQIISEQALPAGGQDVRAPETRSVRLPRRNPVKLLPHGFSP